MMKGGIEMFFVKLILKILALPFIVVMTLAVLFCTFLLACSGLFFGIASFIMFLLGAGVLLMGNTWAGILILVTAFLVSPFGIPLFAEWLVDKLDVCKLIFQHIGVFEPDRVVIILPVGNVDGRLKIRLVAVLIDK